MRLLGVVTPIILRRTTVETLIERCAGLDVHKDTVVACVRLPRAGGQRQVDIRSFGTTTGQLLELRDWLVEQQVQVVGMEATGVYWKPVVRHEAPCIRVGRKESHLRPVAAGC